MPTSSPVPGPLLCHHSHIDAQRSRHCPDYRSRGDRQHLSYPFPPPDRQQWGPDDPVPPPTDPRHGRGHIGVHFWPGEVEAEAVAGVGAGAGLTGKRTVAQLKEEKVEAEAAAAAADVMEAAEEETDTTFTRSLLGPLVRITFLWNIRETGERENIDAPSSTD